ncbi:MULTISPECIES: DJ-1/PfpI family protein [unclassified Variovorax]|jgi:transcriptional regulator GlxA family with amidase domain|uniref:GlxA family transcriptional regulator n=1 Tax=unclassified Variovorax TaxID=663243 RepID=UPI000F7E01C1|nr:MULTISPECIES: DJ-1/PfpI family protein [unclassified Variovorax]RSZ44329.1 helix-turn-helix domain-containing protein [Variovorax sp. 553]RSZ45014.1 helix-turn-helix domain-containing protein [Variovorax sp. 679]
MHFDHKPEKDEEAAISAITRTVVLVAFDGVEVLDVAGPASAFSKATELVPDAYRLVVASPDGGSITTNSGLTLSDTRPLHAIDSPIDTLIVAGGDEPALRTAILDRGVSDWVADVAPRVRRVASVCTGAFALAAAGLLDRRRVTTHWRACESLESLFPLAEVQRDRIYVNDGPVWTSAGVTTGIDLALALIEADLGRSIAVEIGRNLALYMFRGGSQPQRSPVLDAQAGASTRLRELVAWIATNLAEDLSVDALATRACMSTRNFARAFSQEVGSTPGRFVEALRVSHATALLLQTDWSQDKIASHSGFGSLDAFQRAFRRQQPGMTPDGYRGRRQQ